MPTKARTQSKTSKSKKSSYRDDQPKLIPYEEKARLDKHDVGIIQADQGAYFLLIEAIMQNKRLSAEITRRWLRKHGYVMTTRPRNTAIDGSAALMQYEKKVMDLVR